MTFYRRSNEQQRHDTELHDAIRQELSSLYDVLDSAKTNLQRALAKLEMAADIEEDELGQSTGIREAKGSIRLAIAKFIHRLETPPTDLYISNLAAYMPEDKAQELKEKYREG